MSDMSDEMIGREQDKSGINRRTVMKGAAWSVPVIMVATAAPAMASSPPVFIDWGASDACKIPGASWGSQGYDKGYVLWAEFENTTGATVWIVINSITVGGVLQDLVGFTEVAVACATPVSSVQLASGQSKVVGVFSNSSTDSANDTVFVNFSWYGDAGLTTLLGTATVDDALVSPPWTTGGGACQLPAGCTTPPPVS